MSQFQLDFPHLGTESKNTPIGVRGLHNNQERRFDKKFEAISQCLFLLPL
jgi:hypothetical protein